MISGIQIREARAMMKWDIPSLRQRSGVDEGVICRAEAMDGTLSIALQRAALI